MRQTCLRALILTAFLLPLLARPGAVHASYATQSSQLAVTAGILPKPEDFQFDFQSDLAGSAAGADQIITYTITYGSKVDYGTPMVIEAQWSLGSVKEENLYNYDIVSYVPGSATKDYWGTTTPVVDVAHRTITWTITRFPPDTLDKTLRFQLKTPGRYVTDKQVAWSVTAKMRTGQIDVGSITREQLYDPTQFIRTQVRGTTILSADIRKITDTSFTLYLVTSVPVRATIYLGTDPEDLSRTITDPLLSDTKTIVVDGLTPATTYYFRIMIENDKLIQRKTPELFTVTTAAHSLMSLVDQERLIVSSNGVLLSPEHGRDGASILVPTGRTLDFFIPFLSVPPTNVYLTLGGGNVLGASTTELSLPGLQKARLLETQYKTFSGQLASPKDPGEYDVFIETADDKGIINQDVLTHLTVSPPLTVTDADGKPVEKALVYIERYSNISKDFERFPSETYGSRNPVYTAADGTVGTVLPDGEYTFNINALGYGTAETRFALIPGSREQYPTVILSRAPFALGAFLAYYIAVCADFLRYAGDVVSDVSVSGRFMDLSLLTGLTILTVLTTILNLRRIRFSLEGVYIWLEKWFRRTFFGERTQTLLIGFVEDDATGMPVHGAVVLLLGRDTRTVLYRDITNALGEFQLPLSPGHTYELAVKKPGYGLKRETVDTTDLLTRLPPITIRKEHTRRLPAFVTVITDILRILVHGTTDALVIGVTIFNVWMVTRVGISGLIPGSLVTALNLILWLEYHLGRIHVSVIRSRT